MNALLDRLLPKQRRGSKPRCHLITHGDRSRVAGTLNRLIEPWGQVSSSDTWMPAGFDDIEEAQLHNAPTLLPDRAERDALQSWWLAVAGRNSKTPNWDIASTCRIGDKPGLLLAEAKAHVAELANESKGKPLAPKASCNSQANHARIGCSIREASTALSAATGLAWALSRDHGYQMANRFAWSWKVASLGHPVILVYLGFLEADDMNKPGEAQIESDRHWIDLVTSHGAGCVPADAWEKCWGIGNASFIPLIRSMKLPLPLAA